jgi:HSP20 family protein
MIYRRWFETPGWSPMSMLSELENVRRRIGQLYDEFADRPNRPLRAGVFPPVNITEEADQYILRAELPGVKREELEIQATGNGVSITGERKIEAAGENARYHRRERDAGKFSRMIGLPGEIDADRVEAKLSDGILTVTVPKAEKSKPRQISIR